MIVWLLRLREEEVEVVVGEPGRALRDARRAFSLCDLVTCSCLCCSDLVISIADVSVCEGGLYKETKDSYPPKV